MTVILNLDFQGEAPPEVYSSGFHAVKIGGGGYIPHLDIHKGNGVVPSDGSMILSTDVAGVYHKDFGAAAWERVDNLTSFDPDDLGTLDFGGNLPAANAVAIAPSNSDIMYMLYSSIDGTFLSYRVYKTVDRGVTWLPTDDSFISTGSGYTLYNAWMANSNNTKFGTERIAIDPFNPDVVYVGTFPGSSSGVNGMMRTIDGGDSWTQVTEIPLATANPGYCGLAFDTGEGWTTVSGQTRCKRIIIPCNGNGVWESTNGGVDWTNKASNPSTPLTSNYTTTVDNCVIMVNVNCPGQNAVRSVSAVKSAVTYTGHLRCGVTYNENSIVAAYSYYIVAPTAGTYAITVEFEDGAAGSSWGGASGYPNNPSHDVMAIYAVAGTNTASASTIFDITSAASASHTFADSDTPAVTTQSADAMVVCHAFAHQLAATSGYTTMNVDDAKWVFQQYKIQATPAAYTPQPTQGTAGSLGTNPFSTLNSSLIVTVTHTSHGRTAGQPVAFAGATEISGTGVTVSGGYSVNSVLDANTYQILRSGDPSTGSGTGGGASVTYTYAGASELAYIVDAFKKSSTLSINGTPTVVMGSSYAAITKPTAVKCGQIDWAGTYWCQTQQSHGTGIGHGIYRMLKGGTFERIDNTGLGDQPHAEVAALAGSAILVDPREGFEGRVLAAVGSQPAQGWQTDNGNAVDIDDIVWRGQTGGHEINRNASDVGWLLVAGLGGTPVHGSTGMGQIHPITGDYWFCDGVCVFYCPAASSWDTDDPEPTGTLVIAGVEELVAHDVIAAPGAAQPVLVSEDRYVIRALSPGYPPSYPGGQTNGCQGDWAGNDPSYYAVMANEGISAAPNRASWSHDYGVTWTEFETQPQEDESGAGLGGAICVLSYTSDTEATVIVSPGSGAPPRYTTDNGGTWNDCAGLPAYEVGSYVSAIHQRWRTLAASKDDPLVAWCYVAGGSAPGLYRTDDGGANWTIRKTTAFLALAGTAGPYIFHPPGQPNDLFATGMYGSGATILYSSNALSSSVTFTSLPDMDQVRVFAVAKQEDDGTYPTIMCYGRKISTDKLGFYTSKDKGTTWTLRGKHKNLPPVNHFEAPQTAIGDWENAGRFYLQFTASGSVLLQP